MKQLDGLILVNKPKNLTSNDIVSSISKSINTKAGHIGTLDPLATGLLPVLVGKGVKLSKFLIDHDKKYIVNMELGKSSETLDLETALFYDDKIDKLKKIDKLQIDEVLKEFVGVHMQEVPKYSSVKVNGKKLYEYARQGIEIELPKREINIYEIKLLSFNEENLEIMFEVYVSKGTYIRSLVRDIAKRLGTIGVMTKLQRVQVANYSLDDAIDFEPYLLLSGNYRKQNNLIYEKQKLSIVNLSSKLYNTVEENLITINTVLENMQNSNNYKNCPNISLDNKQYLQFLNGQIIRKKANTADNNKHESKKDDICFITNNGKIQAIASIKKIGNNIYLKREFA